MIKLAVLLAALSLVTVACGDEGSSSAEGEKLVASGEVSFDRAFIDAMVPHHREAIAMADAATERLLRDLAARITDAQRREIGVMEPHASGEHHE